MAWGAASNSATFDEPAHLAAGVEYWKRGDFSIYSLSPPLLRLWAGLPAAIVGADAPPTDNVRGITIAGRHWPYADAFEAANFSRFGGLLLAARLGMIPISCFAAWVVFAWAKSLYGWRGGVSACALYALNPGVLANASLVTTDIGTAAAMVAACWLWWRFCRRATVGGFVLVCVACAAAHLCKFTAVLLWPMLLGMAVPFGIWRRRFFLLFSWVGVGVVTLFLLNAVYGFSGTGRGLGSFAFESQFMRHVQATVPGWFPSPVPRTMLLGFDAQKHDSGIGYEGFLFGEIYRGARWYFFPVALACKSPIGLIVLVLVAAASVFYRRPRRRELGVAIAIVVFVAGVMVFGDMDIGTRYLLPMFPLAFVMLGRIWSRGMGRGIKRIGTGLAVIAAVETLVVCPRFLTFVNVASGGTLNGWRVVNNSDFDWGQGLIDLRKWMSGQQVGSVQLAYFGFVDPKIYGVEYTPFTSKGDEPLFAVSSYFLDGLQHRILVGNSSREWIELKFYRELQRKKPVAVVGNTIFIYSRVDVESAASEYLARERQ